MRYGGRSPRVAWGLLRRGKAGRLTSTGRAVSAFPQSSVNKLCKTPLACRCELLAFAVVSRQAEAYRTSLLVEQVETEVQNLKQQFSRTDSV